MENAKPVIVPNAEGQRTTPSVVAWSKSGDRLVGTVRSLIFGGFSRESGDELRGSRGAGIARRSQPSEATRRRSSSLCNCRRSSRLLPPPPTHPPTPRQRAPRLTPLLRAPRAREEDRRASHAMSKPSEVLAGAKRVSSSSNARQHPQLLRRGLEKKGGKRKKGLTFLLRLPPPNKPP